MIRAGLLRERVAIYDYPDAVDAAGQELVDATGAKSPRLRNELWAAVEELTDAEGQSDQQLGTTKALLVRTRYCMWADTKMFMQWRGRRLNITGIVHDPMRTETTFSCRELVN